ncbi:MAG: hypothetical protein IKF60_09405 [Solobacterium sp.]|jgi:hypothetical protein|nr:hypothetical protein [Solobacterium sp.]MBR3203790.1 hypothetical protein [Solobacterium sp.]
MRSQVIKTRNLPAWKAPPRIVHVKPVLLMILLGLLGIGFLFFQPLAGIGAILIIVSVFSILVMPDRILIQFSPDYLVLYNHRDADTCTIIYWDEIVNWQYEYHPSMDRLTINLVNGSSESIELYSKRPIQYSMNQYAPGKEIKSARRKENR